MSDLIEVPLQGIPHEPQTGAHSVRARSPKFKIVCSVNLGRDGAPNTFLANLLVSIEILYAWLHSIMQLGGKNPDSARKSWCFGL